MQYSIKKSNVLLERQLINPEMLIKEIPLTHEASLTVNESRQTIKQIMSGVGSRRLVVVGPCSIHDVHSAMEYAQLLSEASKLFANELFLVMRTYFEKPRTTFGWKGLISDPYLDNSYDVNSGLRIARKLLLELNNMGVPTATEFLDPHLSQYQSDLVSWCAIGARTAESQIHRELASGLPMPVGFKNNTDGNIQIAVDAAQVATQPHHFLTVNQQGLLTVKETLGNNCCHIVLRGSNAGPNFSAFHVNEAIALLNKSGLQKSIVVDCSHGNSSKTHILQATAVKAVAEHIKNGMKEIRGVMLESHIHSGKQILGNKSNLKYGQSITDACMSWEETLECLNILANAIEK